MDIAERTESEERLRQSEERFRIAVECANDFVYERDMRTGRAEFFGGFEASLGYAAGEFPQMIAGWLERVHPADIARVMGAFQTSFQGDGRYCIEYRLQRKDGTYADWYDRGVILRDAAGNPTRNIGAATDITERKWAENEIRQLAAIVQCSDDAIISTDINGIITSWNRGAERIYGYTANETIGKSISLLVPPDHYDEVPQFLSMIERGERVEHYETFRRRKDGTTIEVSLAISWVKDAEDRIIGASSIARDITERKQAQAALERVVAELQTALSKVKQLEGILPICMHCKKIRDDDGRWHTLELYVTKHTEAAFSHGLCPDCGWEHYPDFLPKPAKE